VQQRHQGVHVVTLEGLHVALQQRLLGGVVGIHSTRRVQVVRRHRGPRSLQGAVGRGHGDAQQPGHLLGLPAQHVAQD